VQVSFAPQAHQLDKLELAPAPIYVERMQSEVIDVSQRLRRSLSAPMCRRAVWT
jgi:hypothetical protein